MMVRLILFIYNAIQTTVLIISAALSGLIKGLADEF